MARFGKFYRMRGKKSARKAIKRKIRRLKKKLRRIGYRM